MVSVAPAPVRPIEDEVAGDRFAPVDDDELTRLALAGDPDAPLDPDATPWSAAGTTDNLLPDWYMPAPAVGAGTLRGWRRAVAWLIIGAALAVVASGLCNTYGELVIA